MWKSAWGVLVTSLQVFSAKNLMLALHFIIFYAILLSFTVKILGLLYSVTEAIETCARHPITDHSGGTVGFLPTGSCSGQFFLPRTGYYHSLDHYAIFQG